ncbi:hypothetical protein C1646_759076 [Rhizophagus diaphanus]|nr:hypothetical protein C1646_759076 [Rhizophagus diaphanus] [Rhizophagus sp. MUCL 43196]
MRDTCRKNNKEKEPFVLTVEIDDDDNINQEDGNINNSRKALSPKDLNIPYDTSNETPSNSNNILRMNEQNATTIDIQQDGSHTEFFAKDNSDDNDLERTLVSFFSKKKANSDSDLECAIRSLLTKQKNNDQSNDDLDHCLSNKKQSHHEKLKSLSAVNSQIINIDDEQVQLNKSRKRYIAESTDHPSYVSNSNGFTSEDVFDMCEEMKVLFIRSRNPGPDIVTNIAKILLPNQGKNSEGVKFLKGHGLEYLAQHCSRLNNDISIHTEEYIKIKEILNIDEVPNEDEIAPYITDAFVKDVFFSQLAVINEEELFDDSTIMNPLKIFLKKAFRLHLTLEVSRLNNPGIDNHHTLQQIKELDYLTNDLIIPNDVKKPALIVKFLLPLNNIQTFPTATLIPDDENALPFRSGDIIIHHLDFSHEVHNEDAHYTRLIAGFQRGNQELIPMVDGYIKHRLLSIDYHFRLHHYWPAWSYLQLENMIAGLQLPTLLITLSMAGASWKDLHVEFQNKGAAHTHGIYWTSKYTEEMINNNTIRSDIHDPNIEPELYHLVMTYQIHTCNAKCGGPAPSGERVKKVGWVVPYHAPTLLIWKAHMNAQYVTDKVLAYYILNILQKPPSIHSKTIMLISLIDPDDDDPYWKDRIEKYFARPNDEIFNNITYRIIMKNTL